MNIKRIAPGPDLAGRIRTAQAEQKSSPARMVPHPISTIHPLICFSTIMIPQVPAVEAVGRKGEMTLVRLDEVHTLLDQGLAAYAFNAEIDQDYLVLKPAFDSCRKDIFAYLKRPALASLAKRFPAQTDEKDLFENVEKEAISQKGSLHNLKHLAFMLNEITESGGDYLAATAVLLHNFKLKDAEAILSSPRKIKPSVRKMFPVILGIIEQFKEINGVPYRPLAKKSNYFIQNMMDALIKISKGNGQSLLMLLAHKLSSITMRPDDARDVNSRSVWELFAPLAERFGLWEMASKMRNEAFRLSDPDLFRQCEASIVEALSLSRREAEEYLHQIKDRLSAQLAADKVQFSLIRTRVKTPWGAAEKSKYKPEDYSEIFAMNDLLAGMVVTQRELKLEEAQAIAQKALGEEFKDFIFTDNQTETKLIMVGKKKLRVHHVVVLLKNCNSLELQFMSDETFQVIERGTRAHWTYKLKMIKELADQIFDETLLELCAQRMTGDFLHDVEVVYQTLEPWLYAFMMKEDGVNVYRRMSGSIPLDLAAFVLKSDLSNYGGSKRAKIWEDPANFREIADVDPLEDGDLVIFRKGNFMDQSALNLRAIKNAARHPETKSILLPELPIKPLHRR